MLSFLTINIMVFQYIHICTGHIKINYPDNQKTDLYYYNYHYTTKQERIRTGHWSKNSVKFETSRNLPPV